jgi:DNA topoisomerase-3
LIDAVAGVGAAALLSPELTGEWEKRIADIQDGDADPDLFEREIATLVRAIVDQVKGASAQPIEQAASGPAGVCPRCGAPVSRHGRNWACDAECGFSLPGYLCRRAMRQEEIACLLSGGKTAQLKGFRSQAGKAFSAALSLSGDRIEWHFRPRGRKSAAASGKARRKSAAKAAPRPTAKAAAKAHTSRKPRER